MGGGDLNSKKSWHPNTMKNQERVWKAEQAAAEEKKRMLELQRERAEERDRAELTDIMNKHSGAGDNRLAWMYDKPDKKVEQEAYLLGKALDKNPGHTDNVEADSIPAVSRRVVGSSMLTSGGDAQVDMSRKIREDPLLLIKERERAARAALLNNPLQRRKLTELLRKEQDQRKEIKSKKKPKKKDKDLDNLLAAKLNALGGQQGINLATLLDSDDESSESSRDKPNKKKHKRDKEKSKKKKKRKRSSDSESDTTRRNKQSPRTDDQPPQHRSDKTYEPPTKRISPADRRRSATPPIAKHYRRDRSQTKRHDHEQSSRNERHRDNREEPDKHQRRSPARESDRRRRGSTDRDDRRRTGLSSADKAARLADMAAAGAAREAERGRRVAEHRAAEHRAADPRAAAPAPRAAPAARALPDSLESRLHSARHYIQRDKRHMNEHFARR